MCFPKRRQPLPLLLLLVAIAFTAQIAIPAVRAQGSGPNSVDECGQYFICNDDSDEFVFYPDREVRCSCLGMDGTGQTVEYEPGYACDSSVAGCHVCDKDGGCRVCDGNQQVVNGKCQPCLVERCLTCFPGNGYQCQACSTVWIDETSCLRKDPVVAGDCGVAYCDECIPTSAGVCNRCSAWFTISSSGLCHSQCDVPNCQICYPALPDKCLLCGYGYTPDAQGNCVEGSGCRAAHCRVCNSNGFTCSECEEGYFLNAQGLCINCGLPNCAVCSSTNSGRCATCNPNYKLENGQCVIPPCNVPGCLYCSLDNPNHCNQCLSDYYTLSNGRCQSRADTSTTTTTASPPGCGVANCAQCRAGNSNYCERCNDGYTLNTAGYCGVTGACRVYYCVQCQPGFDTKCRVCNNGYGITTEATCVRARDNIYSNRAPAVSSTLFATLLAAVAALLLAVL